MKQMKGYITGLNLIIEAGIDVRCVIRGKWCLIEEVVINETEKCLDVRCSRSITKDQIKVNTEFTIGIKDVSDELDGWIDDTEMILYYQSEEEISRSWDMRGTIPRYSLASLILNHPKMIIHLVDGSFVITKETKLSDSVHIVWLKNTSWIENKQ